jgi:outer membrane protein OmpA-like peptidoglycan-associated protein
MNRMKKLHRNAGVLAIALTASAFLYAQEPNPTSKPGPDGATSAPEMRDGILVYKVTVVGRDLPAINYFHRSGSTKVGFQGTALLPSARGEAKIDSRQGRTSVDLDIRGLSPANGFGPEYLTYVLWGITPEGRPVNLGEVLPGGSKEGIHMTVTTNLQSFGMIVTAEPYFAVTMPSDIVVMQNFAIDDKTTGVIEQVNAHYSLLPRGAYAETAGRHTVLHPITRNERSPLELYEAENAVQIAEAAGAGKYAGDTLATAKVALKNAEDLDTNRKDAKETVTFAREAVQSSEDARIMTIRKIKAEDDAAQVQAKDDAVLVAQQQAEQRAQADAAAAAAESKAQQAKQAQQAAEASAQQAAQQTQVMREKLRAQLNAVLETSESARGLIVNMSDVLFDTARYTLKPGAREKLAKVSGILLAYPGLKLQVEGYTDNIGGDEYNQKLSERRAGSVKDYLISQNVRDNNISAAGYGKSDPIADNSTSVGRAQNRRVQLVVSGDAIGIRETDPGAQ